MPPSPSLFLSTAYPPSYVVVEFLSHGVFRVGALVQHIVLTLLSVGLSLCWCAQWALRCQVRV